MKHMIFSVLFGLAISVAAQADVTGHYKGEFNGREGVLTVSNSNGYSISFAGADGANDLLGAGCDSIIGEVKKVSEKKGVVKYIRFAFSPNNCLGIWGKELNVNFEKDGDVEMDLFSHTEEGPEVCHYDPMGRPYCNKTQYNVFLTGKFARE